MSCVGFWCGSSGVCVKAGRGGKSVMVDGAFIVVFLTEFNTPYNLNAQRGRQTSERQLALNLKFFEVF